MQRRFDSGELRRLKGESDAPPPPEEGADPLIGKLVGDRFRVVRQLGVGTQAMVYVARHTLIKRHVALKVLMPVMAAEQELVRRFLDEGQVAGTMGHPNIVESLDMGVTDDGRPYLVLELLEGTTITAELERGRFEIGRAAYILVQVASALAAAHERHIVHRDLKPENVFLIEKNGRGDHVKVIDFGVSKLTTRKDDANASLVVGTPDYMAPEQVTSPATVDARADVYAVGAMLYEMLGGRLPFGEAGDVDAVLRAIVKNVPAPITEARPDLPPKLVAIIERAMQKDRNLRYQGMAELQEALTPFAVAPPLKPGARTSVVDAVEAAASAQLAPPGLPRFDTPPPHDGRLSGVGLVAGAMTPPVPTVSTRSLDGAPLAAEPTQVRRPPVAKLAVGAGVLVVMALIGAGAFMRMRSHVTKDGGAETVTSAQAPAATPSVLAQTTPPPLPGSGASTLPSADGRPSANGNGTTTATATGLTKPVAFVGQLPLATAKPGATGATAAGAQASAQASPSAAEPPPPATPAAPIATAPPSPATPAPATAAPATPTATAAPGTISPKAVSGTVRAHSGVVQGCYDRARMNNAELRGRVTVRASVDPQGGVTGASVGATTANDTRLENCLVSAFKTWTFPAPAGGVAGSVTYTFVFE